MKSIENQDSLLEGVFLPLRQATRQITRLYDRHLSTADITATQFTIIASLHENSPVSMRKLGAGLMLERTSLVRALRPLVRDELVYMTQILSARTPTIVLTDRGESKYAFALPLWRTANSEVEKLVGCEIVDISMHQLKALANIVAAAKNNYLTEE